MSSDVTQSTYLENGWFIDSDHPKIKAFSKQHSGKTRKDKTRSVELYLAVRDLIPYDPFTIRQQPEFLKASSTLADGRGFCVAKAVLYAAVLRAAGIPARIGFADVRNHLTTPRLMELMQTDIFHHHGYTEVWLDQRWIKATPAFNKDLCDKFGILPLDFDGNTDSIFHPFDAEGKRHMEYIQDHGSYADVPFEELMGVYRKHYPNMFSIPIQNIQGDFEQETDDVSSDGV
ncbi:MAG: transglutaminase domain-containing protein [Oceanococcus sp.]|nr:MAG: transglutaminase domain-containing protein [Oceanococcus sp.]